MVESTPSSTARRSDTNRATFLRLVQVMVMERSFAPDSRNTLSTSSYCMMVCARSSNPLSLNGVTFSSMIADT